MGRGPGSARSRGGELRRLGRLLRGALRLPPRGPRGPALDAREDLPGVADHGAVHRAVAAPHHLGDGGLAEVDERLHGLVGDGPAAVEQAPEDADGVEVTRARDGADDRYVVLGDEAAVLETVAELLQGG